MRCIKHEQAGDEGYADLLGGRDDASQYSSNNKEGEEEEEADEEAEYKWDGGIVPTSASTSRAASDDSKAGVRCMSTRPRCMSTCPS